MKEEWLFPGAVVPVDVETTAALVVEIKRLIDVVGGMALVQPAQRTWVGLTDEEYGSMYNTHLRNGGPIQNFTRAIEAKLQSKNTVTIPPASKPLTDEQREEIAKGWRGRNWTVGDIIDATEAAHGIKEQL